MLFVFVIVFLKLVVTNYYQITIFTQSLVCVKVSSVTHRGFNLVTEYIALMGR